MPPTTQTIPEGFPYEWASDWGEDSYGIWIGFKVNGIRQGLRWIPPGTFLMGSPESEPERRDDEVQHQVTLTQGFWLADTTCSQALWQEIMGTNPSFFKGQDLPVEKVSWDDVQEFLSKINERKPELNLCLPTEAQWEYACRAGTETPFWFGDNITPEQVNYNGNRPYADGVEGLNRKKTLPTKSLQPNSWGLYQMHGNVLEWCADWYGDYPVGQTTDPGGPETGQYRVLRGGSWINIGRFVRLAFRSLYNPGIRISYCGFRFASGQAHP